MKEECNSHLSISVTSVLREAHNISISFLPSDELQPFFHHSNIFVAEYSDNIENVPVSCAIIPFLVNVLPLAWITDAIISVDAIDKSFYESIGSFKQGYIDMYPMITFKGNIEALNIVDNSYPTNGEAGVLFSGGVDAFATVIQHYNEPLMPITVIGADIKLDDMEGIKNTIEHSSNALQNLSLRQPCIIKTNFRSFLNEKVLDTLVKNSKDGWWHGFQHGIGIIGLTAPIAYTRKLAIMYIASSHTPNDDFNCASHPSIDNNLQFGSTITIHDQFENTRQKKISIICDYHRKTHKRVSLRVCWESRGGNNCCHCEKCLRTIYALYAEGENPNDYGFNYTIPELIESSNHFRKNYPFLKDAKKVFWCDIQKRFKESHQHTNRQFLNWILEVDFNQKATYSMRLLLQLKKGYWYVNSVLQHFKYKML